MTVQCVVGKIHVTAVQEMLFRVDACILWACIESHETLDGCQTLLFAAHIEEEEDDSWLLINKL